MNDKINKRNKIISYIITIMSCIIIVIFIYNKLTFNFVKEYYSISTIDQYKEFQNNRNVKDISSFTSIPTYYFKCSRVNIEIEEKRKYNNDYMIISYTVKNDVGVTYTGADLWQIKGNNVLRKSTLYLFSDV